MKVLIFTDNHFCENSSIIRSIGSKYSVRLENQLNTLNWIERTALDSNCGAVICAGDFFDKPTLTDSELTAIKDIKWSILPHYFLVGNHESSVNGLRYNSTKALEGYNRQVISEATQLRINDTELCFLPYIIESDRKPIAEYFTPKTTKRVIISHNDIIGIQMGPVVSKTGFSIEDFEKNADLTVNGHLHNGTKVSSKVINLGNVTGQNFSEDATKYRHQIMILDLDTLQYTLLENPYAFNFYKLELKTAADIDKLSKLKTNAVASITCPDTLLSACKSTLERLTITGKIVAYRLVVVKDYACTENVASISDFHIDHISKFVECAKAHLAASNVLDAELAEICK